MKEKSYKGGELPEADPRSAGTSADQLGPYPSGPEARGPEVQLTAFSYSLYLFLGPNFLWETFYHTALLLSLVSTSYQEAIRTF
jgi:hypothetical protein